MVSDVNTREASGVRAAREYVFDVRRGLKAGLDEVGAVRERAGEGRRLVAVGSGVITDIVRYAAHLSDADFVSVPTAASMDGYASSVAALEINGVKVTKPARAPIAILADPRVSAAAPVELTRAGLGDLLAKATALVDWLAAHLLYGEAYSPAVVERMRGPLSFAAANVAAVLGGGADSVAQLLAGLIESGVAMAIVGNSRPASGCEHHASHFWDLLAARGVRPHRAHGLQVGHATRYAMRLQRFAYAGRVDPLRKPVPVEDPLGSDARRWLGEPTADVVQAVEEKQRYVAELTRWPRDAAAWETVRASLRSALGLFPSVQAALDLADIRVDVDPETLRATFQFASRLRARYTVIDFLEGQEKLQQAIAEAIG